MNQILNMEQIHLKIGLSLGWRQGLSLRFFQVVFAIV